ncbi:hypothetical protein AB0N09_33360 [Streptomyces erythrochromogenes]|uniref:hypothetical protein n=1 Tax=Streptomyces erythrochromogenes TaxID=285574 RepID=UPI00343F627C
MLKAIENPNIEDLKDLAQEAGVLYSNAGNALRRLAKWHGIQSTNSQDIIRCLRILQKGGSHADFPQPGFVSGEFTGGQKRQPTTDPAKPQDMKRRRTDNE